MTTHLQRRLILLACLVACGNQGTRSDGGTASCPLPTAALSGTIRGLPFSASSSQASWSFDGATLLIELDSYPEDCTYTQPILPDGTNINLKIPRSMLAAGMYQAGSAMYAIDPTNIEIYTAAYLGGDAGITQQFSDGMSGGNVWLTTVTDAVVAGAVCFSDSSRQTTISGTFTAAVCASPDAGSSDAAPE